MNKRRLLKLADLLVADARKKNGVKFDLETWGSPAGKSKDFESGGPEQTCNTAACAMGLACISGAFKRAGLSYEIRRAMFGPDAGTQYIIPLMPEKAGNYCRSVGMDAAKRLFDISSEEAEFLFGPAEYPEKMRKGAEGKRFVAKRIRDFVAGKVQP